MSIYLRGGSGRSYFCARPREFDAGTLCSADRPVVILLTRGRCGFLQQDCRCWSPLQSSV